MNAFSIFSADASVCPCDDCAPGADSDRWPVPLSAAVTVLLSVILWTAIVMGVVWVLGL